MFGKKKDDIKSLQKEIKENFDEIFDKGYAKRMKGWKKEGQEYQIVTSFEEGEPPVFTSFLFEGDEIKEVKSDKEGLFSLEVERLQEFLGFLSDIVENFKEMRAIKRGSFFLVRPGSGFGLIEEDAGVRAEIEGGEAASLLQRQNSGSEV